MKIELTRKDLELIRDTLRFGLLPNEDYDYLSYCLKEGLLQ